MAGLRWNDAVDTAMEPNDLDWAFNDRPVFGSTKKRIGADRKIQDFNLVRVRAAQAYIEAHEGEYARVTYRDPSCADTSNVSFTVTGKLQREYLYYPVFDPENPLQVKRVRGFRVGDAVVPFDGVSSIHVPGDSPTWIL